MDEEENTMDINLSGLDAKAKANRKFGFLAEEINDAADDTKIQNIDDMY
jgi:hypothetical protein